VGRTLHARRARSGSGPRVLDGAGDPAHRWLVAVIVLVRTLVLVGLAEDRRGRGPPPAVPAPRPPRLNQKLAWILNKDNPDGLQHTSLLFLVINFCVGQASRRLLN
jgi:hypothetical protein